MARSYRLLAALVALGGLALQFCLVTKYPEAQSIAQTTTRFLSFFTIQTNILIAVCMLLPALMRGDGLADRVYRFRSEQLVRVSPAFSMVASSSSRSPLSPGTCGTYPRHNQCLSEDL